MLRASGRKYALHQAEVFRLPLSERTHDRGRQCRPDLFEDARAGFSDASQGQMCVKSSFLAFFTPKLGGNVNFSLQNL